MKKQLPDTLDQIVPRGTLDKLLKYNDLLIKWQKTINLVSPTTLDDAWQRHFIDSLQLVPYIDANVRVIADLGSGGGFPGLVLAVAKPDIQFHLVESDARKCAFLITVAQELDLKNVTVHPKRIESVTVAADCVTARALAPLHDLMTWSQHFHPKSRLFLKGQGHAQEIEIAQKSSDCSTWNIFPSLTEPGAAIVKIS